MSKSDGGLRKLFTDNLKPFGHFLQAIETGGTSAGVPDCHGLGPTGTYWVECKKTDGFAIKFEPHQIQWHRKHHMWIPCFVAVRTLGKGSSNGTGDGLALYRGADVDMLAGNGTESASPLLRFYGPSRRWDWQRVHEVLTTRK